MPVSSNNNKRITDWKNQALKELDSQFDKLDIQHYSRSPSPYASRDALKAAIAYKLGLPTKVTFRFTKDMIWTAKGVGKGIPIALAGTSSTTRKQKDWFNSIMDKLVEDLADIVAEDAGDLVVNNIRIR